MLQNLKFKLHGLLNPEEGPNSPKNAANIVETLQSSSDQSLELEQQNENVSPTLAKAVQAAHSAVESLLKEEKREKKDSNKPKSAEEQEKEVREWVLFYRRMCRQSLFVRRVSRVVGQVAAWEMNASTNAGLAPLPPPLLLPKQSAAGGVLRKTRSIGSTGISHHLESALVRLKHGWSRRFQTEKVAYKMGAETPIFFSSDSLTFEFFNTIAPFYPGSTSAQFDVFLCAINSEQKSIEFWDHALSFVCPVNQKRRQSKVLEIWVPALADCCDELLLLVEGRLLEEEQPAQLQLKPPSKMAPLKRRQSEQVGTLNPSVKKRSRLSTSTQQQQVGASRSSNSKGRVKKANSAMAAENVGSVVPREFAIKMQEKPKVMYRGMKTIGKWSEEEEKTAENCSKVFQPMYSHNGVILNIFNPNEQPLLEMEQPKPEYALIEELGKKTKSAARGTCHMLQMEISNEHGFGLASDKQQFMGAKRNGKKKEEIAGSSVEIRYLPKGKSPAGMSIVPLDQLKRLPMPNGGGPSLFCTVCRQQFRHIWELAFHLSNNYPSLHFDVLLPETELSGGAKQMFTAVSIEISKSVGHADEDGENFEQLIGRCRNTIMINTKRKNMAKRAANRSKSKPAGKEAKKPANNIGLNFKGVLPFNGPQYTPVTANAHGVETDKGWIRQLYEQFRFIDQNAELLSPEMLTQLVFHCGVLNKFGHITDDEAMKVLEHAEKVTREWRD